MERLDANMPRLSLVLATATTGLSVWGTAHPFVRLALAVLLLVLPGLALTAALLPRRRLDGPERVLYSLVATVALTMLTGLFLNVTLMGMDMGAWALLLLAITAAAALFAWLRRPAVAARGAVTPHDGRRSAGAGPGSLNLAQVSLFCLAAVIVGLALAISRVPAAAEGYGGYSMLSIRPAGEPGAWQVAVESSEFAESTFSLSVAVGDEVVFVSPAFSLAPHASWEQLIDVAPYQGKPGPLVVSLYRSGERGVYRQVVVRNALRSTSERSPSRLEGN